MLWDDIRYLASENQTHTHTHTHTHIIPGISFMLINLQKSQNLQQQTSKQNNKLQSQALKVKLNAH